MATAKKTTTPKSEAPAPAPAPAETPANTGSEIAAAIAAGMKGATEKNFALEPDAGVQHRFTVVKNLEGEIMLRENETGSLSRIQLQSLEEKEASIQGQEVEEV